MALSKKYTDEIDAGKYRAERAHRFARQVLWVMHHCPASEAIYWTEAALDSYISDVSIPTTELEPDYTMASRARELRDQDNE